MKLKKLLIGMALLGMCGGAFAASETLKMHVPAPDTSSSVIDTDKWDAGVGTNKLEVVKVNPTEDKKCVTVLVRADSKVFDEMKVAPVVFTYKDDNKASKSISPNYSIDAERKFAKTQGESHLITAFPTGGKLIWSRSNSTSNVSNNKK